MNSERELVEALDRLRHSVESLRTTFDEAARKRSRLPSEVYLEDLEGMRDGGLIDEQTYVKKRNGFLDKI